LGKRLFEMDYHVTASNRFYDGLKTGPFAIHEDKTVSGTHSQDPGDVFGLRTPDRARTSLRCYFLNKKPSQNRIPPWSDGVLE